LTNEDLDDDDDDLGKSEIIDRRNKSLPKATMVKVMSDTMVKLKKI